MMRFLQLLHDLALWLGVGYSLFWSTILANTYWVQKLELNTQDFLMRILPAPVVPPEILLVKISERDLKKWDLLEKPNVYANLIERLLEQEAATIMVNLRSNWIQRADHEDNPLKQLVRNHHDRLVLVLPTTCASLPNPTKWRTYNYFIPIDSRGEYLFPINEVLGFSEYEPEEHDPSTLCSTSRRAHLVGNFIFSNNLNKRQELDAAVWLGLKKFQSLQQISKLSINDSNDSDKTPIQVYFWPEDKPFASLNVQTIMNRNQSLPQVRNKIVIVGFANIEDPNSFSIHSPFGNAISNVEFQANFLGSLLTNSFFRVTPYWLSKIIMIAGGVVISKIIMEMMLQQRSKPYHWLQLSASICSSLFILVLLGFSQRLIFPATLALLTWGATGLSVIFSMLFGIRENLIRQQQGEIARLKSIEQEAIIAQARKLLNRICANIHDGPLQELKLIMDSLEILQLKNPHLNVEPILDKIEAMGHHLRQQLHYTYTLPLQITPELRDGLAVGMEKKLQELINSKQLILEVETRLQSLQEPTLNFLWLSAREDIFAFFCEAIVNVIKHAQPPKGIATKLEVTLLQQGRQCTLKIENDGCPIDESVLTISNNQRKKGGYGTKLLKNIASGLPGGVMNRVVLKNGGMQVTLSWNLSF
jgi:signal transduction histidine kinase